jgi:glycosyltransferase involved in cell wall biosynthesis
LRESPGNLRIVHIIYDDCDNPWLGGGGARRTLEIYRRFPSHCEITVLTGFYKGALRSERVGNILYRRLGLPFSYLVSRVTFALCVPFQLLGLHYDVVVEDYSAFSPCFSFFFTRKPVIGSFQNLHSRKAARGKGFFKALGAGLFDAMALRFFRDITAVSPDLTDIIKQKARFKSNIRFIGVGIDHALFGIDRSSAATAPTILYIGRLEIHQKGIDTLLQAFALLSPRPKLVFAGTGADAALVEEMVRKMGLQDDVRFAGRFANEDKAGFLKNAALVVMPSRFEGYPVVPLEAMAAGCAFIGTDIPGTADVTGGCAPLVPVGNVNELAAVMQRVLTDADFRHALEIKGREHSRSFEWDSIAKQFYEFIQHSIDLSGPGQKRH